MTHHLVRRGLAFSRRFISAPCRIDLASPRARLVAGVSAAILALGACSSVAFVDELSIVNRTEYSANVQVTGGDRGGWLRLNTLKPNSTTVIEDVIDQGEVWIFRFEYLGRFQVEVEESSEELAQRDWSIEVPDSFEQGLRDMGVPPPP